MEISGDNGHGEGGPKVSTEDGGNVLRQRHRLLDPEPPRDSTEDDDFVKVPDDGKLILKICLV